MPDDVAEAFRNAGVLEPWVAVQQHWMPYVERKLSLPPNSALSCSENTAIEDAPAAERALLLCRWIALLYVGKRLGTFEMLLEEKDGTRFEGTALTISTAATQLAEIVGETKADAIFRRLERAVDRVLTGKPGKTAGR